ncbi:tyrosine-type recombinase/integrase [Streptomyces virginiae]|uniref:tyrosine-type recombinase/integrase n=1 Tax=Streptomyces virginiae TaxID=1961 RepID=UPI0037ACEC59
MSPVTAASQAYLQAWERFSKWCDQEGRTAMPCTSGTLADYVEHLISDGGMAPASLRVYVSAIRSRHPLAERPSPAEASGLIAAWKTQQGQRQRKTTMLTADQLEGLIATCGAGKIRDRRDAAILTLAVGSSAQAQELEALRPSDVEVSDEGVTVRTAAGPRFAHHVPRSLLDPVSAMRAWRACLEEHGLVSQWAFPLVEVTDLVRLESPSTRHTMRQIVQRRGKEAGLDGRGLTFRTLRASFVAGRGEASFSEQVIAEQATWLPPIPAPRYSRNS